MMQLEDGMQFLDGIRSRLSILVRKLVVVLCLFPVSFIHYPDMRAWIKALCSGKAFFTDMLQKNYFVRQNLAERSLFCRVLLGIPFRIACKVIETGSLLYLVKRYVFLCGRPVVVPLPAGKIALIPGLVSGKQAAREKARSLLLQLPGVTSSIAGAVCSLWENSQDFSGSRAVVMAHWDPEHKIDPYVQYLARSFRKAGHKVIIASASRPENVDLNTVHEWADAIIYRTCSGYDFTSWKAALEFYPFLYSCDELILTNDSFFGPIGSFETVHQTMATIECDFWGLLSSNLHQPHLQSYYLVFSSCVLIHTAFKDFFDLVSLSDDRNEAILYELSLALWLASHGFQPAAYLVAPKKVFANLTTEYWDVIIRHGVPLIKRELFIKPEFRRLVRGWTALCSERGYPIQLVYDYMKRYHINIHNYK